MRYAQHKLGFAESRTLVIGDSESDKHMFKGGELGFLVQNSSEQFVQWYLSKSPKNKHQSTKKYALAVVEALAHSTKSQLHSPLQTTKSL
jgi:hydroxymethylpyrimidine pyrophosphatase-like HAD family hydrolase